jgi:hypothetical protein
MAHGVAPNQLFTWRRLVAQGNLTAAGSGEEVVPASNYRALQNQVRELCRLLGKKTLEAEILKSKRPSNTPQGQKNNCGCRRRRRRTVPDEDRGRGHRRLPLQSCGPSTGTQEADRPPLPDEELASKFKAVIAELVSYGYRRVHAVLKRQALAAGLKLPNHKRVYRVMKSRPCSIATSQSLHPIDGASRRQCNSEYPPKLTRLFQNNQPYGVLLTIPASDSSPTGSRGNGSRRRMTL